MSPLQVQLDRLRRRRGLILVITAIAVIAAVAFSVLQPTTYVGTATLTVSSSGRGPEQDAILAQGYVEYFNEESAKSALEVAAELAPDVTFAARIAASSPIVYVEATATDPQVAATSAQRLTETFREQINNGVQAAADRAMADLRTQIDEAQARLADLPESERPVVTDQISSLQGRILDIQSDAIDNQLKDLQLTPAVTSSPPNVITNGILALFGGLILGAALALALAGAEDRLANSQEVRRRLGLDTLAVVHYGGSGASSGERAEQLKGLANVVSLSDMSQPATLAVTAVRSTRLSAQVAEAVAVYRAQQGQRTMLIRADLNASRQRSQSDRPGLGDFLAGAPGIRLQPMVFRDSMSGMLVLPAGAALEDPYSLFAPDRFVNAVEQAGRLADLVVIDAPSVIDAAESQVVCAAADRTILVLEEGVTRASDAIEACQRLERVHAVLLGAVIGRSGPLMPGSRREERPLGTSRHPSTNGSTASRPSPTEVTGEVEARA